MAVIYKIDKTVKVFNSGSRSAYVLTGLIGTPESIAIANLDNQEGPDLAVTMPDKSAVLLVFNPGSTSPTTSQLNLSFMGGASTYQAQSLAVADVNMDGWPDLIVPINQSQIDQNGNMVAVHLASAAGVFSGTATNVLSIPQSLPRAIAVADFDGDQIPDLAIAGYSSNTVLILLGDGNGNFRQAGELNATDPLTIPGYRISRRLYARHSIGVPDGR